MRLAAALALLALIPACAGPAPIERLHVEQEADASALTIRGDWDDVPASVATGAARAEMAILSSEPTPDGHEFRLQTLGGETGILTAAPIEPPNPDHPGPIRLTARVGTFRNQDAESRLLSAVAARLKSLAGIRTAPIP